MFALGWPSRFAVTGALGGLAGWLLLGVLGAFGSENTFAAGAQLWNGGLIGCMIGFAILGVEPGWDHSLLRFGRRTAWGASLGALGGGLACWVGTRLQYYLERALALSSISQAQGIVLTCDAITYGLGWMVLGLAVGAAAGLATRSIHRFWFASLGAALGSFAGIAVYGIFMAWDPTGILEFLPGNGAITLPLLGGTMATGFWLAQTALTPAYLRVLSGRQIGREFVLCKVDNVVGSDEDADISVVRDRRLTPRHAVIQRDGANFILLNHDAPADATLVNDEPVTHYRKLHAGDRIRLGSVLFGFHLRSQKTSRSGH